MVSYKDINKAIVKKIKSEFPDIRVESMDVKEEIKRPCFKVDIDATARNFTYDTLEREITIRIYYFARDRVKNKIDNLETKQALTLLFLRDNILDIDDHVKAEVGELEFNVTDGVLNCYFDTVIAEDYNREAGLEEIESIDIEF